MDTYTTAKQTNTCVGYLNDAINQAVTALIAKGEKRKEAGISALLSFGGFLLCTALTQRKAAPCNCGLLSSQS